MTVVIWTPVKVFIEQVNAWEVIQRKYDQEEKLVMEACENSVQQLMTANQGENRYSK